MARFNCNGCGRFIAHQDYADSRACGVSEGDGDDEGIAYYHYDCADKFERERMDKNREYFLAQPNSEA